ncbi:MAG: hypothetical protein GXP53_06455 [Deltaproteobacteria bacterium]|nr:hypothetical protein [Deltaproteobacteria bacterium]
MKMKTFPLTIVALLCFSLVMFGCNNNDNSNDTVQLSGTAATGEAMAGVVTATNANGEEAGPVDIAANGSFTIDIAKGGPYILKAHDDGTGATLFSYSSTGGTVNITPLTNLTLFVAAGLNTDVANLYNAWAEAALASADVQAAAKKANANLAALYATYGLDPMAYDFFQASFSTDGVGIDGLYDNIMITLDANGETVDAAIDINDGAITFDINIDISGISFTGTTGGGGTPGDIPAGSTWELSAATTINGATTTTTTTVTGIQVPASQGDFETVAVNNLTGSVATGGITVTYSIGQVTYTANVDGVVGDTIETTMTGTYTLSGGPFPSPTTFNFTYEYTYTRTA